MMKQVTSRILYQKKSIKLGLLREEKIKKEVKILKMRLNNLHFPLMGKEKKFTRVRVHKITRTRLTFKKMIRPSGRQNNCLFRLLSPLDLFSFFYILISRG